ncbi:MAG: [acyl-carrier-protein] S-malonyltransferase [Acidimicrobiia bacterium]|nr:[acyl-carrier-protein] S-malonyltransferase [Acidimicrobiia bacterium]
MLAFIFPGQGSQKPGMGRSWIDHPSWSLVALASEASGRDVAALLLDADADELRRTENAQLSTYVLSLVIHDAVRALGVRTAVVAGHSLGEYSALTAVGALSLTDGVRLVAARATAMQSAADARPGTMAAVLGADDDVVAEACARVAGDVWVANTNGAGQVVISGDADAIASASALAKEMGARKVLLLSVGGAFHTPFMAPAADRLRAALDNTPFANAEVPVIANVDGLPHQHADQWADLLEAQLTAPVLWRQTMQRMVADGITTFVELGPGSVLTGLAKRSASAGTAITTTEPGDLNAIVASAAARDDLDHHGGEHLFASERLVVSPTAGLFVPASDLAEGQHIERGRIIGHVAGHEIRSPFHGTVKGLLAVTGERLTRSQPVAWLRTA